MGINGVNIQPQTMQKVLNRTLKVPLKEKKVNVKTLEEFFTSDALWKRTQKTVER